MSHVLIGLHRIGAALLKAPILVITEEEAKQIAAAITRLTELYEVSILDEKSRAWFNLGLVGVEVYGTRVTAAMMERKKRPPAPQIIRPFERHTQPQQPPTVQNSPTSPAEIYPEEVSSVGQA